VVRSRIRPTLVRRLLLALVIPPLLVALLLAASEAVLALLPDVRPRWFDRVRDADGRAEFVRSPVPPKFNDRIRTDRLPVVPPPGTRRVVCLGDSTVYGVPFEPPIPFADVIALRLQHLLPDQRVEVRNLGVAGICSQDVLDLVRELDGAGADLLVVYVGHNEFLEMDLLPVVHPLSAWTQRLARWSRSVAWLERMKGEPSDSAPLEALRKQALVHDAPLFTPRELDRAFRLYREHLEDLADFARARSIALVICRPVCDLLDTEPRYSVFSPATAPDSRAAIRDALAESRRLRHAWKEASGAGAPPPAAGEVEALLAKLDRCLALDDRVAQTAYERGSVLLLLGRHAEASASLEAAVDLDGYPWRLPRRGWKAAEEVARSRGVPFVDASPLFRAEVAPLPPGQNGLFVDYVHPDRRGHELLAEAILRELAARSLLAPTERWRFADEPSFEEYRRLSGFDPKRQADAWARDAFLSIGLSSFDPERKIPLRVAREKIGRALALDPGCAAAHFGLGVIATIERRRDEALSQFEGARARDPAIEQLLAAPYAKLADLRRAFDAAGLTFDGDHVRAAR
jgi:lysophospholipase L1-like esterase